MTSSFHKSSQNRGKKQGEICLRSPDNKLTWKSGINTLANKLSNIRNVIHQQINLQVNTYLPLFTLKLVYHTKFHSLLQYFLLNWGRICKSHFQQLLFFKTKFFKLDSFVLHFIKLMHYNLGLAIK